MAPMRISVITPCINQAHYLERTICSVLDQGYDDLEYILIDGGSTDGSAQVARLYAGGPVRVIEEPCVNPARALNEALAQASGDLVGVLYADDLYLPGALAAVSQARLRHREAGWFVGRCLRIGASDEMLGHLEPGEPRSLASFLMHDSGPIPAVSSFFDRGLLDRFGGFDENLEFAFDYELWCRFLAGDVRPRMLGQVLAAKREHADSRSAVDAVRQGIEYINVARRHGGRLPVRERCALWANCEERRRIYALAQAELHSPESRRFLWQQLVRHPWWLANSTIRQGLLRGMRGGLAELAGTRSAAA